MIIEKASYISGARDAKGLCVIIDVFRACSVLCYVANQLPTDIIVSRNLKQINDIKSTQPMCYLIGKNHEPSDNLFNTPNSPSHIHSCDLKGKIVVQHSEGGIRGLVEASSAEEIIAGSFVNANAIVRYIMSKNPQYVTLVSMGFLGIQPSVEDDLCAEYIKCQLLGIECDKTDILNSLEKTSKHFFLSGDKNVPLEDYYLCTDFNRFDFVLKKHICGEIIKLERINI